MPLSSHAVRELMFLGKTVPVLQESDGGASPLLALANVLLLRNSLQLKQRTPLTPTELLSLVASKLLDPSPSGTGGAQRAQALSDAVALLPGLARTGLADVRFTRVHDFEYTPESVVFELLDVFLVHGWLAEGEAAALVGARSHSQLVERVKELADGGASAGPESASLSYFLSSAPGGLSSCGLRALAADVPDRQLCVLYRGGGYYTAFRREECFYLLRCRPGAPGEHPDAVWELLQQPLGPCPLVNASFQPLTISDGSPALSVGFRPTAPNAAFRSAAPASGGVLGPPSAASALPSLAPAVSTEKDFQTAMLLQTEFEDAERANRKALRQAAARLQRQQEKGVGGQESTEVRDFVASVDRHVQDVQQTCALQ